MNPFNLIKGAIEKNLEKQGMSLTDFEQALENMNTPEGTVKVALLAEGILGANTAKGGLEKAWDVYKPFALGMGGMMGLGASVANESVGAQNKQLDEIKQNIELLRRMNKNLKAEHGL